MVAETAGAAINKVISQLGSSDAAIGSAFGMKGTLKTLHA
jgi:hypothetical protein